MSLYIIFLGIVPIISLVSFGIWYIRNTSNGVKQWKKANGSSGPISTYVCSIDCFKKTRLKPAVSSSSSPSKSRNKVLLVQPTALEPNKPYTISERLGNTLPRDKIRIVKRDLVSTTNPQAINSSSEIERRQSARLEDGYDCEPRDTSPKHANPLKTELGIKLAEHIQQLQRVQPKNFKGLTLKTDLKFEQMQESPTSSLGTASQSAEAFQHRQNLLPSIPIDLTSKPPASFYDKKPPPPPASFYDKKPPPPPASYYDKKPPPPPAPFYDKKPPPPPAPFYDKKPPPPPQ